MFDDSGITLITCSGISNTGKLTTKAGEMLIRRYPGLIELCLSVRSDPKRLLDVLVQADCIVVLDGCSECCGVKKVQEQGYDPNIHLIATDYGITKAGMEDPRFDEIDILTGIVRERLR